MRRKKTKSTKFRCPYVVRLTFGQITALVDIATDYIGDDSPRFHNGTLTALASRGLIAPIPTHEKRRAIVASGKRVIASLSPKGHAALELARWEYEHAESSKKRKVA